MTLLNAGLISSQTSGRTITINPRELYQHGDHLRQQRGHFECERADGPTWHVRSLSGGAARSLSTGPTT